MFQRDAISHEQESIWQSSIAEVDLRTSLVLIFAATNHQEIIKLVLFPGSLEIVLLRIHFQLLFALLLLFPLLFLPESISISLVFQLIIELFYKFEIFNIIQMYFF